MEEACVFFCSSLLEDLKRLEQALAEGSVSLRWSAEAMNLLKKMQVELLALLSKSQLPISYGAEEDWFDQYMKETEALLDFCNSLKSAVSGITRYRMAVDVAVPGLRDADPSSSSSVAVNRKELERVERERRSFLDVAAVKGTTRVANGVQKEGGGGGGDKHNESINVAMLAAKNTMTAVSQLLVSAIVSPVAIDMGSSRGFPQLKPLAVALTALVGRFKERVPTPEGSSGVVLFEHEMVDRVVGDLKAQLAQGAAGGRERFLSGVELLRTRSDGLREGIQMLDAVLDEVFDEVIRGRDEMLGLFRDGALSTG